MKNIVALPALRRPSDDVRHELSKLVADCMLAGKAVMLKGKLACVIAGVVPHVEDNERYTLVISAFALDGTRYNLGDVPAFVDAPGSRTQLAAKTRLGDIAFHSLEFEKRYQVVLPYTVKLDLMKAVCDVDDMAQSTAAMLLNETIFLARDSVQAELIPSMGEGWELFFRSRQPGTLVYRVLRANTLDVLHENSVVLEKEEEVDGVWRGVDVWKSDDAWMVANQHASEGFDFHFSVISDEGH